MIEEDDRRDEVDTVTLNSRGGSKRGHIFDI